MLWSSTFSPAGLAECRKWRKARIPKPSLYIKPVQEDTMITLPWNVASEAVIQLDLM